MPYTTAVHLELLLNLQAEAACAYMDSSCCVQTDAVSALLSVLLADPPSGGSLFLLVFSALVLQRSVPPDTGRTCGCFLCMLTCLHLYDLMF